MSWMMDYTKQELFSRGQDAGLGVFPLNTAADVYAEEQYRYREFFQDVEHPIAGTYEYPGISYKLSAHQSVIRNRAPLLGEHNSDVFVSELGRSPEDSGPPLPVRRNLGAIQQKSQEASHGKATI